MGRTALVLSLALLAGCIADTRELCGGPLYVVTEPATMARPADVLFIVNNSRSMGEEQAELARSFSRFIDEIAGSGEYRIAVVTTDQSIDPGDRGEMTGTSEIIHAQSYPFGIIDIDDTRCAPARPRVEHGCFRGPANQTVVDASTLSRQQQIDRFGRNVRVGTCGSGSEQAFDAMSSALRQLDGCNRGFRRDDANLVLIFVSDEDDHSFDPIETYVDDLESLVDLTKVRVSIVVGTNDGDASYCKNGTGPVCGSYCADIELPGSHTPCAFDGSLPACGFGEDCQYRGPNESPRCVSGEPGFASYCATCSRHNFDDCCSAAPGLRYVRFAKEIERRIALRDTSFIASGCRGSTAGKPACLTDTICQNDFGETLAKIARDLVSSNEYALDPPVEDPRRLEVHLVGPRGERKLERDTHYVVTNEGSLVRLLGAGAPEPEDTVRVRYTNALDVTGTECLPN